MAISSSPPVVHPSFELYIHVPFCRRRCGYCDFNTYTASDLGGGASRQHYADLAIKEMHRVRDWQESRGIREPPISSIFFGGGTPTILPADDLIRMLDAAQEIWGIVEGAEVTTEANPDTVDQDYLSRLVRGGFTRISLGMQSALPHVLKTLDRTHTPENVVIHLGEAQSLGLETSLDLIYGTPGESLDDWQISLETALGLGINHLSAYALTLEPTTKMGRAVAAGTIQGPDDDDEARKYELADQILSQAGLEWYEISNWAKPGHECRHNLGYWKNVDWAGIGPGAHSHYGSSAGEGHQTSGLQPDIPRPGLHTPSFRKTDTPGQEDDLDLNQIQGDYPRQEVQAQPSWWQEPIPSPIERSHSSIRAWDIAHPRSWAQSLDRGTIPWQGAEALSRVQDLEETVMLGLRLRQGLDLGQLTLAAKCQPDSEIMQGLIDQDLLVMEGEQAHVTLRGRLLNDLVVEGVLKAFHIW